MRKTCSASSYAKKYQPNKSRCCTSSTIGVTYSSIQISLSPPSLSTLTSPKIKSNSMKNNSSNLHSCTSKSQKRFLNTGRTLEKISIKSSSSQYFTTKHRYIKNYGSWIVAVTTLKVSSSTMKILSGKLRAREAPSVKMSKECQQILLKQKWSKS